MDDFVEDDYDANSDDIARTPRNVRKYNNEEFRLGRRNPLSSCWLLLFICTLNINIEIGFSKEL